jgi:dihydrofolate synthase/folylpolyglutamate synthase
VACTDPLIIVDGAHNEDAWLRLRESLDKYFTNERIIYIMGVFADKEYHKMIRILAPTMKKCYTVESDNPRALGSEALASKLREAGVEAEGIGDVRRAIDIVRNNKIYDDKSSCKVFA